MPLGLGVHDLPLFAAAALLVNLTPGPDMLFVIGSSAAHGRRAGVLAALDVGAWAGCMVHIALAAFGLSALLAAPSTASAVIKWLGAAYAGVDRRVDAATAFVRVARTSPCAARCSSTTVRPSRRA